MLHLRTIVFAALAVGLGVPPSAAWAWPGSLPESDGSESAARRSDEPFVRPESLEPAIRFWKAIFTQHDSSTVVVHDKEHMDVIWHVVEYPKDERGAINERLGRELVRTEVEALRARLERLERTIVATDEEDSILLALIGHDIQRLVGASQRIRSQRGVADRFTEGLQRSTQWLAEIHTILTEEGVPVEIAALPFVESMFNPKARSSAGAAGLWQLMPATARGLGLKVTADNDERLDVRKATRGAAKMMRQNYKLLGTWPLAITGYNHGPYGVRRAVQQVGSTDLVVLIENYQKSTWGFSSKNFYAEFLAVLSILGELPQQEAIAFTGISKAAETNDPELETEAVAD